MRSRLSSILRSLQPSRLSPLTTSKVAPLAKMSASSILGWQDKWSKDDSPDLTGRYFLVTGASAGLGYQTARYLLQKNATVVFHARNAEKLDEVLKPILPEAGPNAKVEKIYFNLESFKNVKRGAEEYKAKGWPLHTLILNAGLFLPPHSKTEDGFEVQLQTNYYSQWLLAHLLLPTLLKSAPGRIVWTSSQAADSGKIQWDDLKGHKDQSSDIDMYGQSKLMDLLASLWMNKKLSGRGVESFAAHPGIAATDINSKQGDKITAKAQQLLMPVIGQSEERGAIPIFRAAVDPTLTGQGGEGFFGPSQYIPNMGDVSAKRDPSNKTAADEDAAARLYLETRKLVEEALGESVPPLE